jgi:oxygen-independent coproporphyrinogen III oxidase
MDISVYIHIPYCLERCHYCDFFSFAAPVAPLPSGDYLELLTQELALRGRELILSGCTVTTLYIGGGTPTVLSADELSLLLTNCRCTLPLVDQPEWTVEANPGTVNNEKLSVLSSHGVNRVSLGVQDTDDSRLTKLGRRHSTAEAHEAFILCRRYFPSVSADLMYGLPGQTPGGFFETLDTVLGWRPDHLSLYGLKVEHGTNLAAQIESGMLALPDEEEALAMLLDGRQMLKSRGYEHYEIANYALPGHRSRHNLNYWHNKHYLGLGLGAHSYWQNIRLENTTDPFEYRRLLALGKAPVVNAMEVGKRQEMEDTMILGLRLLPGVSFNDFKQRFGRDPRDVFSKELDRLRELELIICDDQSVRLSERGFPVANNIFAEFIAL